MADFPVLDPVPYNQDNAKISAEDVFSNALISNVIQSVSFEAHYRLTDQFRFTNADIFVYHGPDNAVTGKPDPIRILVNTADYKNVNFYFEANFSGQNLAKCEARLYNTTTGDPVPGSVIQSLAGSVPVRVRSGPITMTVGSYEYAVQYRRLGGNGATDYPAIYEAHLVVRKNA